MIKPVVKWCLDHDINMIQMPCPETLCATGGLGRDPHGKAWYEKNGLRITARKIAKQQTAYALQLRDFGCDILAVIGMDFSPACATNYLNVGRRLKRDEGIYIEELQAEFARTGLAIPFIGVNQRALKKLDRELKALLDTRSAHVTTG